MVRIVAMTTIALEGADLPTDEDGTASLGARITVVDRATICHPVFRTGWFERLMAESICQEG